MIQQGAGGGISLYGDIAAFQKNQGMWEGFTQGLSYIPAPM
jgi:hypothetical protein